MSGPQEDRPSTPTTGLPYRTPELVHLGSVAEMTAAGATDPSGVQDSEASYGPDSPTPS